MPKIPRKGIVLTALWAIAQGVFLTGCSFDSTSGDAIAADDPSTPPSDAMDYGTGTSQMSQQDLIAVMSLQYPQSYEAIKNRFGFPSRRSVTTDYYPIEGTSRWVAIHYHGTTAIDYSFSDSGN
ncbi:hypothetical protein H6G89_32770 [Oscillatoria sp. FACHB-1407]|uniref:hypothetical protein n=1 Tax=Oscillatoria sp. FACHB-1407 TaxID=2692847 RepID=UPI001684DA22|nr:hypothetical protein [Oscillatoria sp. FACHB-1407]MBD2465764.1 hypothetical protein [Oscillatoria sp. FACHB-1407]